MKNGTSTCQHSKAETPSGVYAVGSPPGADDGRRERKENMALHWQWEDKCGEATLVQMHEGEDDKVFTLSLYPGNAYLIMLHEREEDGKDVWSMFSFWADKDHMKNMLGLNKKDAGLVRYKANPEGKQFVVTDWGEVVRCDLTFDGLPTGMARISHFATCPNAKQHRKR